MNDQNCSVMIINNDKIKSSKPELAACKKLDNTVVISDDEDVIIIEEPPSLPKEIDVIVIDDEESNTNTVTNIQVSKKESESVTNTDLLTESVKHLTLNLKKRIKKINRWNKQEFNNYPSIGPSVQNKTENNTLTNKEQTLLKIRNKRKLSELFNNENSDDNNAKGNKRFVSCTRTVGAQEITVTVPNFKSGQNSSGETCKQQKKCDQIHSPASSASASLSDSQKNSVLCILNSTSCTMKKNNCKTASSETTDVTNVTVQPNLTVFPRTIPTHVKPTSIGKSNLNKIKNKKKSLSAKSPANLQPNFASLPKSIKSCCLRPISIDASNVAMAHGKDIVFSCLGIKLCIDFFLRRGHTQIKAFVPRHRLNRSNFVKNQDLLCKLSRGNQYVVFTPSRKIRGKVISSYDDRFVLDYAVQTNGVIVSNDNYRDLIHISKQYLEVIQNRLLMFAFADDLFMVPDDPLGKFGPNLDTFLQMPVSA